MASLVIRNLEDALKARLRLQAARNQHSMEDEVREILRSALGVERSQPLDLAAAIRKRFAGIRTIELPEPPREALREPPEFD